MSYGVHRHICTKKIEGSSPLSLSPYIYIRSRFLVQIWYHACIPSRRKFTTHRALASSTCFFVICWSAFDERLWLTLIHNGFHIGAIGGTVGFIKTRSLPSLIGGIVIGSFYGLSGHRIQSGQRYGHELGESNWPFVLTFQPFSYFTTRRVQYWAYVGRSRVYSDGNLSSSNRFQCGKVQEGYNAQGPYWYRASWHSLLWQTGQWLRVGSLIDPRGRIYCLQMAWSQASIYSTV